MKKDIRIILKSSKVVVFDMDGTLYRLNSVGNTYAGSSLEKTVLSNAESFIRTRALCAEDQVKTVLENGLSDPIGLSAYLQNNYGITRSEYFNEVWNIDPVDKLTDYEGTVKTMRVLNANKKILVLLTSSPKIWQEQVCNYLGITELFDAIYTGEDFGTKDEIFAKLSQQYSPTDMISVGDQYKTDIEPAQKYGINTVWVKEPKDMQQLLEN